MRLPSALFGTPPCPPDYAVPRHMGDAQFREGHDRLPVQNAVQHEVRLPESFTRATPCTVRASGFPLRRRPITITTTSMLMARSLPPPSSMLTIREGREGVNESARIMGHDVSRTERLGRCAQGLVFARQVRYDADSERRLPPFCAAVWTKVEAAAVLLAAS